VLHALIILPMSSLWFFKDRWAFRFVAGRRTAWSKAVLDKYERRFPGNSQFLQSGTCLGLMVTFAASRLAGGWKTPAFALMGLRPQAFSLHLRKRSHLPWN